MNGVNDPVWNEVIPFDIVHGQEPLIVRVCDRSDIGRDGVIGECRIGLDMLKDQYKHDELFPLTS